jgi:hypothetical protein
VRAAGDDDLLGSVTVLEGLRRALDAVAVAVAGEIDARDLTDRRYGHRTKDWLASEQALERGVAGRRVRVATKLRRLPIVAAALAEGRISFEHARVVADLANPRVLDALVGLQDRIVELAQGVRFERWAEQVRALVDLVDQDGGHDPREERNSLHASSTLDGVLHLKGTLVGDTAASVKALLDAATDRAFRRAVSDARETFGEVSPPDRAGLRAEALVDLVRRGAGADSPKAPAADVTVTVPVDHPALIGHTTGPRVADGHGGTIDGRALDLLCCDAVFRALIVDSLGNPLDLGSRVRFATGDQRRAVLARDGGCVFPGCDAHPGWVDLHHVIRAADGGTSDLDNLAALCRHHHGVVHRHGWHMRHVGHQRFTITTARGATLVCQRHGTAAPAPAPDPPPDG